MLRSMAWKERLVGRRLGTPEELPTCLLSLCRGIHGRRRKSTLVYSACLEKGVYWMMGEISDAQRVKMSFLYYCNYFLMEHNGVLFSEDGKWVSEIQWSTFFIKRCSEYL